MTASYSEARDAIFKIINETLPSLGIQIIWPDSPSAALPLGRVPWVRIVLQHVTGGQATLAHFNGTSRYQRTGILAIQLFTPCGEGLSNSYNYAKIISDSFDGVNTLNGLWFRNVRLNEVGPDADWYQVNILVDFVYDEVK